MVMKSQSPLTQVLAHQRHIALHPQGRDRCWEGISLSSSSFFPRFIVRVKVGEKLANGCCSTFNVKDCVLQVAYMSPA